jgi:response regulator RpfG family c-di-GMP phosphodiesterase
MQPYVIMLQADPDDKDITETTLAEMRHPVPIKFITEMNEWDQLIASSGNPSLILMNDRGTKQKGAEILKQLKSDPSYSHIPIIVLGEVSTEHYIRQWYHAGANSFIIKPSTISGTRKKIEVFFEYWFDVAAV